MTTVRIPTCLGCIHCEKQMTSSVLNTMHVKMTCKFPGDVINPPPRIDTIPAECPDAETRQARLKLLESISMKPISIRWQPRSFLKKPKLTIGEESHIQNACPKTTRRGITDSTTDLPTPASREPNQKGLDGELARFCEVFKPIPDIDPDFPKPGTTSY